MTQGRVRGVAIVAVGTATGLLAVGAVGGPARAQVPTDGPLKVYSSLPLSGDARPQSVSVVRGMKLALADHGGRAGNRDISFTSLNDATAAEGKWEPRKVAANARRATRDDATIGYLGEFNSGASAISMPLLNRAGIAQISPSNTYVGPTRPGAASGPGEPGKYAPTRKRTYARVIPADHLQARAVVAYMKDRKVKRIAIVHDGEVYGQGLASFVRTAAKRAGIRVVSYRRLRTPGRARSVAAALKRTSFDGFFFGGITQTGGPGIFRAVGRAKPKAKLFGPDGVAESAFSERLGRAIEKRVYVTNPTLDPKLYPPAAQPFFEQYRREYGTLPEPYAIYGYEAMALLLDAIDRAAAAPAGVTRPGVVEQLFATRDRSSVLGTYSIDARGDTTLREYGGNRIRNGKLVFDVVLRG